MPDSKHPGLEDDPVAEGSEEKMQALAAGIDDVLNGDAHPRPVGFILITFNFADFDGGEPRANYVSNADRADVVAMLRELIGRWEAQEPKGEG